MNLKFDEDFIQERIELLNFILNLNYFYLATLFIYFFLFLKFNKKFWKFLFFLGFIFSSLLLYAQNVERFWIKTNFINLNKGWDSRVILIADQHLGVYKNGKYMEKVVEKINKIPNVDFVVIAGDFTYWPKNLKEEHSSLEKIKVPIYAVLGNHDLIQSGVISHKHELEKILPEFGVKVLENEIVKTKSGITIFGLGSHTAHTDDVDLLKKANTKKVKILILTHNPDTTEKKYPNIDLSDSVTMTGHTHCGQVRVPELYKYAIPTKGYFPDRGPYDLDKKGTLLITCGLGEVGLPMRFNNRPEILVVDL